LRQQIWRYASWEKYPTLKRATGLWLGEAVHFVKKVEAAGYEVDYVSPKGGYTPIDPHSLAMAEPVDWEWYQNKAFMNRLGATLSPEQLKASYYAGGHGVVWDFPDNPDLQKLARQIYEGPGIVSSVCHGAVGLLNIKLSDGKLLVKGKRVTGFLECDSASTFTTPTPSASGPTTANRTSANSTKV
jgi:putative intracellular protease/amidase